MPTLFDGKEENGNSESRKLDNLVKEVARPLYKVKAVWPFDFSPDSVVVDEHKVDICIKYFFRSAEVISVPLESLKHVVVNTSPFFSQMTFEVEGMEVNPQPIKFLPTAKALKAKTIIDGLIAAKQENVDLSKIPINEVKKKVEAIGHTRT